MCVIYVTFLHIKIGGRKNEIRLFTLWLWGILIINYQL